MSRAVDDVKASHAGLHAKSLGQLTLADTGLADHEQISLFFDEATTGQFLDGTLVDPGIEGEVEARYGLLKDQATAPDPEVHQL